MKKKILVLLLVIAMILPLAACGSTVTPTRGEWNDNVYTSEYLGLRVTLPNGWHAATEAEIAEIMGLSADVMSGVLELDDDFWDNLDDDASIHDMMATDALTGSSVQIMFARSGRLSASAVMNEVRNEMTAMGVEVTTLSGTTNIGGYDWYAFDAAMEFFGMTITMRYYINVESGFARTIVLAPLGDETMEDLLAMFSEL
ncbi:MAG: hypothetical protein FWE08_05635 [Oscillospiraceae bacterium]|nr:hypothetical protein [Oscillospiraceae bacterium]